MDKLLKIVNENSLCNVCLLYPFSFFTQKSVFIVELAMLYGTDSLLINFTNCAHVAFS